MAVAIGRFPVERLAMNRSWMLLTFVSCLGFLGPADADAQAVRKRGRTTKPAAKATETPSTEAPAEPAKPASDSPADDPAAKDAKATDKDKPAETEKDKVKPAEKDARPKIETATLGAGCFWSTEAVFEKVKGVKSVVSGFSGGNVPFPSYQQVCTGSTGHAEVIQVAFDPSIVSYEKILKLYFHAHDPTTLNAQGDDFGTQYRSVIFHHTDAQKETALKVYRELTAKRAFRAPIVTQLVPYQAFYPAEPYHQDYYRNHPASDYTLTYIIPKLRKMAKVKVVDTPDPAKSPAKDEPAKKTESR